MFLKKAVIQEEALKTELLSSAGHLMKTKTVLKINTPLESF